MDEVDRARDGFYLDARRSIGVRGGSVGQFEALRARRSSASAAPEFRSGERPDYEAG